MFMIAVDFLPRTVTERHQKLKIKVERYKENQKQIEPKITPENELRIRDNVTQLAFAIRQVSNSQLYKQAGNSITVSVIQSILKNLLKNEI